jgi:hypothetical protein
MNNLDTPVWLNEMGEKVSCTEKIKVMNQNLAELSQTLQDAYDDAVLMGVDKNQIRKFFHHMVDVLQDNY